MMELRQRRNDEDGDESRAQLLETTSTTTTTTTTTNPSSPPHEGRQQEPGQPQHQHEGVGRDVASKDKSRRQRRSSGSGAGCASKVAYGLVCNVLVGLTLVYIAIPVWFYSCPWLREQIVFLTAVSIPPFLNLSNPDAFGLYCPQNFYVESEPGLKLGAWYVPSKNEPCHRPGGQADPLSPAPTTTMFSGGDGGIGVGGGGNDPVILYLHGNAGSRGGSHRVGLYKMLSGEARAHVVAVDYRGYGDSSTLKRPTVDGLVVDAMAAYRKIRETVPANRIIVWGHSLGTGVSSYLVAELTEQRDLPAGLVLESPFDVLANAVRHHPMSRLHRVMPYFETMFVDAVKNHPNTNFDSASQARRISPTLPVMILHAKDDAVVPYELGDRLYRSFAEARRPAENKAWLELVTFASEHGYGHKYIYTHPGLAKTVRAFFDEAISRSRVQ